MMKFAAPALLAGVLFSDDAEAHNKVRARCVIEDAKEGDTVGWLKLSQITKMNGEVRPIKVFGKLIFGSEEFDEDEDWLINIYDDSFCSGNQVGDTYDVNEKVTKKDKTRLKGKLGDGTIFLYNFFDYSIEIVDEEGVSYACCNVSDLFDPLNPDPRMLDDDFLQV